MKRIIFTLLCMLPLLAPAVSVPKTDAPPMVDGWGSDPAWTNAPWHSGFTMLNQPEIKDPVSSRFKVLHDNRNIYFLIECEEPDRKLEPQRFFNHDDNVFLDDCIEIAIDPNCDKTDFYQFIISPWGVVHDVESRQAGAVSTPEWNSAALQVKAICEPNRYTVEMAVPIVDLGIDAATLQQGMAFNVARTRFNRGPDKLASYSTFAPLRGGFRQPADFLPLKLENADLAELCWNFKLPYETVAGSDGSSVNFRGKLFVTNLTGKIQFAKMKLFFADSPNQYRELLVSPAAGQGREVAFDVPASGNGSKMLIAELTSRCSGKLLARRNFDVRVEYTPLSLRFLVPAYRDNIYAGENCDRLKVELDVNLPDSVLGSARGTLTLRDGSGKTIVSHQLNQVERNAKIELPIPALTDGEYFLCAELTADGKPVSQQKRLRKLPPAPGGNELRFDTNKIPLWNNEPILLYGWFNMDKSLDSSQPRPTDTSEFNLNQCYPTPSAFARQGEAPIRQLLDGCQARGEKLMLYPYPSEQMISMSAMKLPLSPQEAAAITNFVNRFKDHPALAAWYLADEPELRPALPERMRAIGALVAELDPYHPAIMLNDSISGIHKYIGSADISMPDPYPGFMSGGVAAKPIETIKRYMDAVQETGTACWITPQGFNTADFGRAGARMPTVTEMRNMQYQAISGGATAICWWSYYCSYLKPEFIHGAPFLAREAKLLRNVILSPHKRIVLKVGNVPQDKVFATYYPNIGGASYLIVVNCDTRPITPEITLPASAPKQWVVVSEKRSVETRNGVLGETMEPYGTHIYSTRTSDADALDWAEVKRLAAQK